jgi:hypothetical protein
MVSTDHSMAETPEWGSLQVQARGRVSLKAPALPGAVMGTTEKAQVAGEASMVTPLEVAMAEDPAPLIAMTVTVYVEPSTRARWQLR